MAEVTGMRNNALPYPVYGMAYYVVFPLLDADGDPISPSSPDSEVSKNGDTFADCTNEATEIATSSGSCYLLLTSSEMTADVVVVQIKSTGAKTTVLTLYPRKLVAIASGTCQGSNDTGDIQLASGDVAVDDYYNGCLVVAVIDGTTEARIINDYVGSTKVAEVSPAWNTAQPDSNDTYTIYLPEGKQVVQSSVMALNGGTQSLLDLKDFADDGYDPSTNKVQGVVLVDTLTTYTSNTPQTGDSYAIVNSGTHGNAALRAILLALAEKVTLAGVVIGSTGNDATHVHLSGLTYPDDGITGNMVLLYDNSTGRMYSNWISAWVLSTELATLGEALPFTLEDGVDFVYVLATKRHFSLPDFAPNVEFGLPVVDLNLRVSADVTGIDGGDDGIENFAVWTEAIDGNGIALADAVKVSGSAMAANNIKVVYDLDFSTNYNSFNDQWDVTSSPVASVVGSIGTLAAGAQANVRDAVGLSSANLDAQLSLATTGLTIANVTHISGIRQSGGDLAAKLYSLNNLSATQARDAVWSPNLTEPTGVPVWSSTSVSGWLGWLGALSRNKIEQTSSLQTLYNDVQSTGIGYSSVSDDGVFIRGEWT